MGSVVVVAYFNREAREEFFAGEDRDLPPENPEPENLDELAELLESDEDLEVKMLCLECSSIFTGGSDQLSGADGCPNCGSEDLEVV